MTEQHLLTFAEAWSTKNIDEVMRFFTEDCMYRPSIISDGKESYSGKSEVAQAVEKMMKLDNSLSSKVSNIYINGDFGFWEWKYKLSNNRNVTGCDLFKFRDDLITIKNAFRKMEEK
ncbi:nuclear transport factor 2 family protein [Croceitalea rosinachiae]|uniref:Nuclear transport factor 2 family protein n=1 Tax=Croceitalea rosinachiae TaxID=3075596 RepID=A0ABU3AF76_9FLAO|nr:nuclear transport factor 2 family protein [Croceitalea sp. F388]MDT0608465.1 nuclear transport factor 2 family protein [Croceitalea sp. F388]